MVRHAQRCSRSAAIVSPTVAAAHSQIAAVSCYPSLTNRNDGPERSSRRSGTELEADPDGVLPSGRGRADIGQGHAPSGRITALSLPSGRRYARRDRRSGPALSGRAKSGLFALTLGPIRISLVLVSPGPLCSSVGSGVPPAAGIGVVR
jgi:hypothetical protein